MRNMMTSPIQKAEKLPATKPTEYQRGAAVLGAIGHFLDVLRVGADKDFGEFRNQRARHLPQLMMEESNPPEAGCATPLR